MRHGRLLLVPALALWGCAKPAPPQPEAPTFGVANLGYPYEEPVAKVHVAGVEGIVSLSVRVTIGVDGRVIDAAPDENIYKLDPAPGVAAVRRMTFRPQSFEGHPIKAVSTVSAYYYPLEIEPDSRVPFPTGTPETTEITLERSGCLGLCPSYRVSIRGDGHVRFSMRDLHLPPSLPPLPVHKFGSGDVLWSEPHEAKVDPKAVASLLAQFRKAHFMGMQPRYFYGATDASSQILRLTVGGRTKDVVDYLGDHAGMPQSVKALQDAVDQVAGTRRWVRGNRQTIAELKQQGFDFKSRYAAEMVAVAITLNTLFDDQRDLRDLVTGAMAEGLDLNWSVQDNWGGGTGPLGAAILAHAARVGDEALFSMMARQGVLARMTKPQRDIAFANLGGCSPAIAKALVAAGADPKAHAPYSDPARWLDRECAHATPARAREMVKAMMALGAPLRFGDDPVIAAAMLEGGANPNAKDAEGRPPLLTTDDDRVALLLLRAGADPRAKGKEGTVRQRAAKQNWPATRAWLDGHGVR